MKLTLHTDAFGYLLNYLYLLDMNFLAWSLKPHFSWVFYTSLVSLSEWSRGELLQVLGHSAIY